MENTANERLREIAESKGVDLSTLPDGTTNTLLKAILKSSGGDIESLPDWTVNTLLKAIAEHTEGGGGSGGAKLGVGTIKANGEYVAVLHY